jgi:putative hydrolase of the HAD superfamily
MTNQIILTDADNTLWDTDSIFANAQIELLSVVEAATANRCLEDDKLAFVRRYDQAIAALHHAHLKYPPSMLVSALVLGIKGLDSTKAAELVIRGRVPISTLEQSVADLAVEKYLAMLGKIPELLPTVNEGIMTAREAGITVYVLTEGKIEKQKKFLSHHLLDGFVAGVFEVVKNQTQFERLRQRFAPAEVIVIGDQPDRDVVPARGAGCVGVLVPGRFRPNWHNAEQWKDANYIASTFKEAIDWIVNNPSH